MFIHKKGFWLSAAVCNTSPGGGKGAAQRCPGTAAPLKFPHSRSFRRAGATVVCSSARLLLARDELTPEVTVAGKRDRAGLPAVRSQSQPARSSLDPKPGARGSSKACSAYGPRGLRLALLPACASLPPPAADSDGLGLGASGCEERARPCGTSPAPPHAQPDFLRRRAPGTRGQSPRDPPQSMRSWSA